MTATVEELKRAWQAVEAGHFRTSRNPLHRGAGLGCSCG